MQNNDYELQQHSNSSPLDQTHLDQAIEQQAEQEQQKNSTSSDPLSSLDLTDLAEIGSNIIELGSDALTWVSGALRDISIGL
ncbi:MULTISPECIES: hypothetical protein [unclassified Acinetobacter]|uniref:hypothetical protein n=1 Tax=unclassified Acinetobacter TaxID=196816 RepID=UPI0015D28699|nr:MULTISPECIES: hypothetical protein [unclassified Acinetobacter]QOW49816.1 hypothetical protein G0029_08445 [Acinetobacter sp. YH12138]